MAGLTIENVEFSYHFAIEFNATLSGLPLRPVSAGHSARAINSLSVTKFSEQYNALTALDV